MQSYRELVFEGSLPVVRAFLVGLAIGRNWSAEMLFCDEVGIAAESRGHRLLEKLHLEKDLTHVLVPERQVEAVHEAIRAARGRTGLRLRADRGLRGAGFHYEFETFSRPVAARIRRLLAQRPESVTVEDCEQREEEHPEARGAEGYAPAHDYVFAGCGNAWGPFTDLLTWHRLLAKHEWMQVSKIRFAGSGRG
ncbi:MAG: hypothetical protein GF330_06865 [Candidatus Eisenbacteria bacterium]|nr:hypothetical protein [Candidatus Eisenbacteria bacterium]